MLSLCDRHTQPILDQLQQLRQAQTFAAARHEAVRLRHQAMAQAGRALWQHLRRALGLQVRPAARRPLGRGFSSRQG